MYSKIALAILIFFVFVIQARAEEICFEKVEAIKVLNELRECRINKEILSEQEKLIENLKKQNELLREQIELLKAKSNMIEKQRDLYKTALESEKRKHFFDRVKDISLGTLIGILIGGDNTMKKLGLPVGLLLITLFLLFTGLVFKLIEPLQFLVKKVVILSLWYVLSMWRGDYGLER